MKQASTAFGSILVIALIGLAGYAIFTHTKPLSAVVDVSGLPAGKYVEQAEYYDIAANYATSTPFLHKDPAADAAAIALMKKSVGDTIAQFKSDGHFAALTPAEAARMGLSPGRKEKLDIVYLIASSTHTVSYIFTIYEDTLGAHGNMTFTTFTFDASAGAPLSLADLFTPGADYLARLSQISRGKLPGIIGGNIDAAFVKNFIEPGTTPEEKHFENFFLDNRELVILFAPYQVAPYSAGPQTLRIPVSDLADILKPEHR